jgi:putative glutamine amidotransferase
MADARADPRADPRADRRAGSRARPAGRPLIVIPARFSQHASALRYRAEVTAQKLVEAVFDAGGEPLVVHPAAPAGLHPAGLDALVRERLWMADGILLPGGGDLAARWSGQRDHHTQYDVDETQDAFDLALARVAMEDGIPLLAVCRGAQVVNVARGGDLIQDLAETLGADHRHVVHTIDVLPGSPLRAVVDAPRVKISCYHHQGISRLGRGLRAAAYAEDGTIEAITAEGHDGWCLGVQWHPEDTADTDPHQAALFRCFVEAAGLSRR